MPLTEVSAKVRTGPPIDDEDDMTLPVWAGVIPLTLQPGPPESGPLLNPNIGLPDYIHNLD